jgi:hypothetical protein
VPVVGQDEQPAVRVGETVAVALAAGGHQPRLGQRLGGVEQAQLGGDVGARADHHEPAAERLRQRDEVGRVLLLVDDRVVSRVLAQPVRADPERPQVVVQLDVEDRAPVLRPLGPARHVRHQVR